MNRSIDPKRIARQKARSDLVRASLARAGDDGTAVRHVVHYAFPAENGDPVGDAALRTAVAEHDFEIDHNATGEGLMLVHHREVASADFDALVAELQAVMAGIGWDYDGWECAVSGMENEGATQ